MCSTNITTYDNRWFDLKFKSINLLNIESNDWWVSVVKVVEKVN